ncbi:hypothetical protein [Fusobacterium russii]|uniref:hypothetical protein n=1 Tax=Fusobacterium russii TaxID=854 RepID=UPI00039C9A38|nr:hypothetical protein [Fusobacterium russii]
MKKIIFLILFCFSFLSYSMEEKLYKEYYNARFGYSLDVPVENIKVNLEEREADNGDGIMIIADQNITSSVFGGFFISMEDAADGIGASPETLKNYYNNSIKEHSNGLAYHIFKKDYCVISYLKNDVIYYEKIMLNERSGSFVTVQFSYPKNKNKEMKPVVERVSKSLKVNLPSAYDN